MEIGSKHYQQMPLYLAAGAAAAGTVSIGASHTLLGLALALMLVWRRDCLRAPAIWPLVAVFLAGTLLALAVSSDPRAGLPQVKKFYVWAVLFAVYSGVRTLHQAVATFLAMACGGCASGAWGLVQFFLKYRAARVAGRPFYESYVADRITGFNSHWMTFSAQIMIGLVILVAYVLFMRPRSRWSMAGVALLAVAQLAAFTRSVWGGAAAALVFLILAWKPRAVFALPVAAGLLFAVAPTPLRQRIESAWRPDAKLDSNEHRSVLRSTGYRIIAARPWFGVGPEQVERHLLEFAPPETPRPLPKEWYVRHLHNVYLQFGAERGLPVLLLFLAILAVPLHTFCQAARHAEGELKFVLLSAAASIIGIAVSGWWEYNLGDSEVLGCFLAMLGCGYAAMAAAPVKPRRP